MAFFHKSFYSCTDFYLFPNIYGAYSFMDIGPGTLNSSPPLSRYYQILILQMTKLTFRNVKWLKVTKPAGSSSWSRPKSDTWPIFLIANWLSLLEICPFFFSQNTIIILDFIIVHVFLWWRRTQSNSKSCSLLNWQSQESIFMLTEDNTVTIFYVLEPQGCSYTVWLNSLAIWGVTVEPQGLLSGDIQVFSMEMGAIFSKYKQKYWMWQIHLVIDCRIQYFCFCYSVISHLKILFQIISKCRYNVNMMWKFWFSWTFPNWIIISHQRTMRGKFLTTRKPEL